MDENELLPLAVLNSLDSMRTKKELHSYIAAELEHILPAISSLTTDTKVLLCIVPVEKGMNRQTQYKLEQSLESLLEEALPDGWSADAYSMKKNGRSFSRLLSETEALIHRIAYYYPYETILQLQGLGDGACFRAVSLESIKQFGSRHGFLIADGDKPLISMSKSAVSNSSWRLQIRGFLMEYDFQGALELVKNQPGAPESFALLLKMMESRLNFCFRESLDLLEECEKLDGKKEIFTETKKILQTLLSADGMEKDMALIEELYRQMEVCIELDDLPAFLTRFYRAREAILLFLLEHGAKEEEAASIKKSSIYQLIEELEKKYESGEVEDYIGTYFYLKSLNVAHTLQVRNQSFIGHGREEIKGAELWHSYYGTKRTTVAKVKRRFLLESNMMLRDLGAKMDDNFSELIDYMLELKLDVQKGQEADEESRVLPLS
ncbi:hypothetical protein [Peribacillus kribbensis]|uniref:hypothetical protein n=1 Tax=Peribacillus kribbensis TaxID=356658 RepID=UPI0004130AB7|nr:hypothetical protein [Peribacillus kribbensis]